MSKRSAPRHPLQRAFEHGEEGQYVVVSVILILLVLAFSALAIDVGMWFTLRTKLQADADAMALAGAWSLPDKAEADLKAREWATYNGVAENEVDKVEVWLQGESPKPTTCASPRPSVDFVTVILKRPTTTFVARLVGIVVDFDIPACATAVKQTGPGMYAIFANCGVEQDPPVLYMSGQNGEVVGRVHSNCDAEFSGSDLTFDGPVTCGTSDKISGSDNEFLQGEPVCPDPEAPREMPINYTYSGGSLFDPDSGSTAACTMQFTSDTDLKNVSSAWQPADDDEQVIKPGIYCSTKSLTLSSSPSGKRFTSDAITLVAAGKLTISGSGGTLRPNWNNLLLFSTASDSVVKPAIEISGQHAAWEGTIFAPNGQVSMSGSGHSGIKFELTSSIIADTVKMEGSDYILKGSEEDPDNFYLRLVE